MTVSNIQLYKMPTYTTTASAGENGSISPDGAQNVDFRGSATYTITPDEYYLVEDVKVDGVSVGAVKTYTFENVRADHTIAATFRSESLPLTITGIGGRARRYRPQWGDHASQGAVPDLYHHPGRGLRNRRCVGGRRERGRGGNLRL